MKVRFGFVAMALSLTNASPSQTMTYKVFQSIPDREAALLKTTRIAQKNLHNTLRILRHAKASGVEVYRFSSKLIPLFTHEDTKDWNFIERLHDDLWRIGEFVRRNSMRVSFHPDHFAVLNSPKQEVLDSAIKDLMYHVEMLDAMGLDNDAKLVLHVGGGYKNKEQALQRFAVNWSRVPSCIQQRVTLENDDKTFTARETLKLCKSLSIPMVFDVHHHLCNHEEEYKERQSLDESNQQEQKFDGLHQPSVEELSFVVEPFLTSWSAERLPPKAHVSSPRDEKNFRAHADNINPEDLLPFLDSVREYNVDIDIMLEAKRKDEALFLLMQDLEKYPFINILNGGSIKYRP